MKVINRKISTMQRFFEIVESMPNPECTLKSGAGFNIKGIAKNKNGICEYTFAPDAKNINEVSEFERKFKPYIFNTIKNKQN